MEGHASDADIAYADTLALGAMRLGECLGQRRRIVNLVHCVAGCRVHVVRRGSSKSPDAARARAHIIIIYSTGNPCLLVQRLGRGEFYAYK